jgi:hypothetical protein
MENKDPNGSDALLILLVGLFIFWGYCISEFLKLMGHALGLS